MSSRLPGVLVFVSGLTMMGCAHNAAPPEEQAQLSTGKLAKSSSVFLAERGSDKACQGDSDCNLGEICYPENNRCILSYPNPRMLDIAFTGKEECKLVNVYFPYDSTELVDEAQRWLQYNARCAKSRGAREVILEGHADSRGPREYNLKLSVERAESAAKVLGSAGVAIPVQAKGAGEHQPLRTGKTEKDYAWNRRVEFTVH
jgi:outer membrane protein OmpA-like peptidoglycan-associated protein